MAEERQGQGDGISDPGKVDAAQPQRESTFRLLKGVLNRRFFNPRRHSGEEPKQNSPEIAEDDTNPNTLAYWKRRLREQGLLSDPPQNF